MLTDPRTAPGAGLPLRRAPSTERLPAGDAEIDWRHASDDHRFCASPCAWAATMRPLVLAAGLDRGTAAQPLALVLVSPATGRALFAGQVFASHREAKPARTRAGGGGWAAKSVGYLVCARCRSLH